MALLELEFIDSYLVTTRFFPDEISSIIALIGEDKGSVLFSIQKSLLKKIISAIMALPEEFVDDEVQADGIGELINMIAGGVKSRLSYSNIHFMLNIPQVIINENQSIIQYKNKPSVVLVYKVGNEYFAIMVSLMAFISKK
jgi:CheY-specific phosphatase CheX